MPGSGPWPPPAGWQAGPYGAPAPSPARPRGPAAPLVAALVGLLLLAAGGGVWWWWEDTHASSTVAAPDATPVAERAESEVTRSVAVAPAALTPGEQLEAQVARDRPAVEAIVGQWVPQIGSKQVGTVDNGKTYDEAAIWDDVVAAKARFPQTELLRSDDYSSFKRGGFWVLVVATPFASSAQANAWCEANAFSRDDCFAKRLSHSDGPQGNTAPR